MIVPDFSWWLDVSPLVPVGVLAVIGVAFLIRVFQDWYR